VALAGTLFSKPHQVVLLIQRIDSGPVTAGFFIWNGDRMEGDFSFMEFPFDTARLARDERAKIDERAKMTAAHRDAAGELIKRGITKSRPLPSSRMSTLSTFVLGFLASLLMSGLLVAVFATRIFPGRSLPLNSIRPAESTPSLVSPTISLGLQAERQNSDLKLSWNRESSALLGATSGILSIREGGSFRQFTLDPTQIRSGSILYAPATDQIEIQLTVQDQKGANSESVIVVLPKGDTPPGNEMTRREVPAVSVEKPSQEEGRPKLSLRRGGHRPRNQNRR
jgi:hypothetical protein